MPFQTTQNAYASKYVRVSALLSQTELERKQKALIWTGMVAMVLIRSPYVYSWLRAGVLTLVFYIIKTHFQNSYTFVYCYLSMWCMYMCNRHASPYKWWYRFYWHYSARETPCFAHTFCPRLEQTGIRPFRYCTESGSPASNTSNSLLFITRMLL